MTDSHKELIQAVSQLDKGQRVRKAERNEPTIEVSEYHLTKSVISNDNVVRPEDLTKSLGKKANHHDVIKKLKYSRLKCKVLPKPLEKVAAERIKRRIGFDETRKELNKWNSIIARNRTADHLSFPLNHSGKLKNSPTVEFLKRFRLKSSLMEKLEEADPRMQLSVEEEKDNDENKVTEVWLRRNMAKLRAMQSYKEAKAHRERKIKSKKFHRIQMKTKIKQQLKEFEELKNSDPEALLVKLEQLDKTRALERMSLRHKNTGQWAKNKQIRAKYDKNIRQELAEQLAISRQLTLKMKQTDDTKEEEEKEEEEEENEENEQYLKEKFKEKIGNNKKYNWWTDEESSKKNEIEEFAKNCKDWHKKEKEKKEEKKNKGPKTDHSVEEGAISTENKSEKQNTDETNKRDNPINQNKSESEEPGTKAGSKNLVKSANQKTKRSTKVKKENKKRDTKEKCIIISEKTQSNTKVKLCKKVLSNDSIQANTKNKKRKTPCNDACNTEWDVESIQCNKDTKTKRCNKKSKISNLQSVDEMFDSLEHFIQHKADLELEKKKLEINNKKKQEQMKKKKKEENNDDEDIPDLTFKNFNPKPILNEPLSETTTTENVQEGPMMHLETVPNTEQTLVNESNQKKPEIDSSTKKNRIFLNTKLPDITDEGEDALDNEEEQKKENYYLINETFNANNFEKEFKEEKEEEIKNSQSQNIDENGPMPGWGNWSGLNINDKINKKRLQKGRNRRKKRTVLLNVPKPARRKDENSSKLIIFEDVNKKLKKHLVSELPHPFTAIKDFEATLRAPVSRTFVPENAHLRLIQPAIDVKIGQVIEPMDENVLVNKSSQKHNINKKSNNKRFIVKNNKKK